jgi:hypothetical protein
MSYEEIPNLLYSGQQVYVKSALTGGNRLPQVPMGVEGQTENSPRTIFLNNIFDTRTSNEYTFYDENNNKIGKLMDIGQDPQTNNYNFYFRNGEQKSVKGQSDVIYYDNQSGGRRRKTRGRKSRRSKRRTRRY